MRYHFVILTIAPLMACGSARNTAAGQQDNRLTEGTYSFFAGIPGQNIKGTMRVLAEEVLINSEEVDCGAAGPGQPGNLGRDRQVARAKIRAGAARNSGDFHFSGCDGVTLAFDRGNVLNSTWYAAVPVRKQRQVCDAYVERNGARVCARQKLEEYEALESASGTLLVRRETP